MHELVYYVATSLDEHIAGPAGYFYVFPTEGMAEVLERFANTLPTAAAQPLGINQHQKLFSSVLMVGIRALSVRHLG